VAAEASLSRTSPPALRPAEDAPSPTPASAPASGEEGSGADARADAAASAADALQRRTMWRARIRRVAGEGPPNRNRAADAAAQKATAATAKGDSTA
jgi:hypothetical protein